MSHATTPQTPVELAGIRCNDQGLCEMDGQQVMVQVARAQITRITLRHGIQAPHPIVQIVVGLLLMTLAYFPAFRLIHWLRHGGLYIINIHDLLLPIPIAGAWMFFRALRRGYFLEVELQSGSKRLAFARTPEEQALTDFLREVETRYGLQIVRSD